MPNRYSLGLILFLAYIYAFTGVHSDDFIHITQPYTQNLGVMFKEIFTNPLLLKGVTTALINLSQFTLFKTNFVLYDIVKVFISFFFFYSCFLFFLDYVGKQKSALISLFILLYPSHDATNYWVTGEYFLTTMTFIFLSHYLINHQKYLSGFGAGILGAFASYASLPFNLGLSLIFLAKKEYKKFILFLTPQLLYVMFYFISSRFLHEKSAIKGSGDFSIWVLIKQFILQIGTGLDAVVGPSLFLKVYYSLQSLTWLSIVICTVVVWIFYTFYKPEKNRVDGAFTLSLFCIVLSAFGIFALTGLYPQIAFNLGDRVTIYGSVIVSFVLVMYGMENKKIATLLFTTFLFSIVGISDHWKSWNKTQLQIMERIAKNSHLKAFDTTKQLFVSHHQYSKLGVISHIEFFAEGIPHQVFKIATQKDYNVSTLNQRFYYDGEKIVDKKYGTTFEVGETISVYDSFGDKLLSIKKEDINAYIASLPKENRHWVQLLDRENFIMKMVLTLMPRLEYAL